MIDPTEPDDNIYTSWHIEYNVMVQRSNDYGWVPHKLCNQELEFIYNAINYTQ